MAVQLGNAVGKAVQLLGFDFTVLHPARDVPPGGGADVYSKVDLHKESPFIAREMTASLTLQNNTLYMLLDVLELSYSTCFWNTNYYGLHD